SKGKVLILDHDGCADWYGLTALINKLDNGDVSVFDENGRRAASREDLKCYLKELPLPFFCVKQSYNEDREQEEDSSVVSNLLKTLLEQSPMKLLALSKALTMTEAKGHKVTRAQLLNCAKNSPERFRLFESGKDTLIQLNESTSPVILTRMKRA
ncbi:MAG: hypothetical protein IK069_04235, partial [Firmicutes bacterium]|nr:hypothetical protein [Bacillota bacterium]